MNSYPKFAQIENRKYRINTDFRVAIKCNKIALDENISDEERAISIIYLLFGEKGIKSGKDIEKLLKIAVKYLSCGKEIKESKDNEEVDLDFDQDWGYIKTSFFYDYGIKIRKNTYMHWWEFYDLLCGLSDKCILNRVRYIRNFDISKIKDSKEKEEWIKQKEQVALKKIIHKTPEQERLDELFEKQLRGG